MHVFVICNNDGIEHVVVGTNDFAKDDQYAESVKRRLESEWQKRNLKNLGKDEGERINQIGFWHIHRPSCEEVPHENTNTSDQPQPDGNGNPG